MLTCADHMTTGQDHHFFLGQTIHQFTSGHPEEPFRSWMRRWPEVPMIRYFGFANSDAILVNSLQGYKEVLHTKCYSFIRTTAFRRLIQDIIGVGLVFAEGEEHRRQRRALGGMTPPVSRPAHRVENIRAVPPADH